LKPLKFACTLRKKIQRVTRKYSRTNNEQDGKKNAARTEETSSETKKQWRKGLGNDKDHLCKQDGKKNAARTEETSSKTKKQWRKGLGNDKDHLCNNTKSKPSTMQNRRFIIRIFYSVVFNVNPAGFILVLFCLRKRR
jgi:hypothetical protein